MQKIAQRSSALRWSQPSALHMHYELRAGSDLVATLQLRGMFGTLATAVSGDGSWTFKRVGFFQNRATIRAVGQETDLAVFHNHTWSGGGALEFATGRRFLATTGLWSQRLDFTTESEAHLVRFQYGGVFRRAADVEVEAAAQELPELPLLVLFGFYLLVMLERDSAAVVSTG